MFLGIQEAATGSPDHVFGRGEALAVTSWRRPSSGLPIRLPRPCTLSAIHRSELISTCTSMALRVVLISRAIQAAQPTAAAPTQMVGKKTNATIHSAIKNGQRRKAFANRLGVDSAPGE